MTTYKIRKADVRHFLKNSFPEYTGRMFRVTVEESMYMGGVLYPGGGTGSRVVAVMNDGQKRSSKIAFVSDNYDRKTESMPENVPLLLDSVIVEWEHFCGKDVGITIHVHPDNPILTKMIGKQSQSWPGRDFYPLQRWNPAAIEICPGDTDER